jgi:hypothetical protein
MHASVHGWPNEADRFSASPRGPSSFARRRKKRATVPPSSGAEARAGAGMWRRGAEKSMQGWSIHVWQVVTRRARASVARARAFGAVARSGRSPVLAPDTPPPDTLINDYDFAYDHPSYWFRSPDDPTATFRCSLDGAAPLRVRLAGAVHGPSPSAGTLRGRGPSTRPEVRSDTGEPSWYATEPPPPPPCARERRVSSRRAAGAASRRRLGART